MAEASCCVLRGDGVEGWAERPVQRLRGAGGDEVFHIMGPGKIERASMNAAAIQERDGTLVYPGGRS